MRRCTSSVNSAVFSPDGKYVLTHSSDGKTRIWDVAGVAGIVHNPGPTVKKGGPSSVYALNKKCLSLTYNHPVNNSELIIYQLSGRVVARIATGNVSSQSRITLQLEHPLSSGLLLFRIVNTAGKNIPGSGAFMVR